MMRTMTIPQRISANRFFGVYLLCIFVPSWHMKLISVVIDHLILEILLHLFLLFVFVNYRCILIC